MYGATGGEKRRNKGKGQRGEAKRFGSAVLYVVIPTLVPKCAWSVATTASWVWTDNFEKRNLLYIALNIVLITWAKTIDSKKK